MNILYEFMSPIYRPISTIKYDKNPTDTISISNMAKCTHMSFLAWDMMMIHCRCSAYDVVFCSANFRPNLDYAHVIHIPGICIKMVCIVNALYPIIMVATSHF